MCKKKYEDVKDTFIKEKNALIKKNKEESERSENDKKSHDTRRIC